MALQLVPRLDQLVRMAECLLCFQSHREERTIVRKREVHPGVWMAQTVQQGLGTLPYSFRIDGKLESIVGKRHIPFGLNKNLFLVPNIFYGQADRKGGGVSPLGANHKQMWKFWPTKKALNSIFGPKKRLFFWTHQNKLMKSWSKEREGGGQFLRSAWP